MTNIKDQLQDIETLKKENQKQKRIIQLQYQIINNYKGLFDVISEAE